MNCDKTMEIHVFGNFPEIAWQACKAARQLIPCFFVSRF